MRRKLIVFFSIMLPAAVLAQVPQSCIELPSRKQICDHQLYKRAPVNVEGLDIKQGQMVCLCMADFQSLRIPIKQGIAATEQQVELTRAARSLGISESELIKLVRD